MTTKFSDEYTAVCPKCYNKSWDSEVRVCRRNAAHGDIKMIDRSDLAPEFTPYYYTQERVKVRMSYGREITGTVSRTMGWKPSYMLMRKSTSIGSSDLLDEGDHVIAVRIGRKYVMAWRSTNYRREDGSEPYADVPYWNTAQWYERESKSAGQMIYPSRNA